MSKESETNAREVKSHMHSLKKSSLDLHRKKMSLIDYYQLTNYLLFRSKYKRLLY